MTIQNFNMHSRVNLFCMAYPLSRMGHLFCMPRRLCSLLNHPCLLSLWNLLTSIFICHIYGRSSSYLPLPELGTQLELVKG